MFNNNYYYNLNYLIEKEFNFNIVKLLGKGTFGIVKKCLSKLYKKYFAIKWIE